MTILSDCFADELSLRVLLADDSRTHQKMALMALSALGEYTVTIAGNGREAIAAFEQQEFDLVLMDIEMPEMNGIEATIVIRDRERHTGKHTPVVALTATGDPQRCRAAGMDGYIAKPLTAPALGEVIARLDIFRPLEKTTQDRRSHSKTHFVTAGGDGKSPTAPLA